MGLRSKIFAATYDRQTAKLEAAWLGQRREELLSGLSGRVLEIGGGTGANLGHYGPGVESLTVTEPDTAMLKRLDRQVRERAPLTKVLRAPAEDLPFEDAMFDTVVSTLVLCGVSDQSRALRQIRRVLRPGGELRFMEHVRSDDDRKARHQDRMNWLNRLVVCCDCNRPTLDAIEAAGFEVTTVEHFTVTDAPSFIRPWMRGVAVSPGPADPDAAAEPTEHAAHH
jgi:ubiquinone/menaquinone biosynthesis C-methylase UbiE